MTVAMITHEVPGDSFWDLIRKGAEAAAKKDNIELRYSNDPEAPNQANLVQSAIDSGVDGIAVTLAKPDAMAPAVKAAEAKGIPVVAFNSGFDNFKSMGVQEYFGQDEKLAGIAAGEKLNADGAKKVICVIQEQGQVALESRCAGVKEGFKGQSEILNVNSKDMPSVEATITAKLQQDPVRRPRRRARRADRADRRPVGGQRRQHRPRSSRSTPTPRSSTPSRAVRCSGPSTSSRTCRATSPSTRCGCSSTTRT